MTPPDRILRVSQATDPNRLGKSIAMSLQEIGLGHSLDLSAMGPLAVNTAVKGAIIARQQLAAYNLDFTMVPSFQTKKEAGSDLTLVVLRITLGES